MSPERTQRLVLSEAPRRVKHICNVWTSCHRAALQGRRLCLQGRELKRDHEAITGWMCERMRSEEEEAVGRRAGGWEQLAV